MTLKMTVRGFEAEGGNYRCYPSTVVQKENTHWWRRVFEKKHVGAALRALVVKYRKVALRRLFFLKPLTRETVGMTCVAWGARARLATVSSKENYRRPCVILYVVI